MHIGRMFSRGLSGPTGKKLPSKKSIATTTEASRSRKKRNAPTLLPPSLQYPMALTPSRTIWSASRQALRPLRSSVARPACRASSQLAREPTALLEKHDPLNEPITEEDIEEARPRWSYTPERLKAPHGFSINRIKVPQRAIWHVNEDPAKLDDFYERFLGRSGPRMLPEEIKWLAVTHKSFDYGRRGFNTRLAYLGMSTARARVSPIHVLSSPRRTMRRSDEGDEG